MKSLKIALMLGVMFIASSLYTIQVKAQEKDSIVVVKNPVFSGNEKNLTDTLLAYADAANSPEFKAVVTDAATVIKSTPKNGSVSDWIAYILAALGAVFGVIQYIRARTATKEADTAKNLNV